MHSPTLSYREIAPERKRSMSVLDINEVNGLYEM